MHPEILATFLMTTKENAVLQVAFPLGIKSKSSTYSFFVTDSWQTSTDSDILEFSFLQGCETSLLKEIHCLLL